MKFVIQRVKKAKVDVDGCTVGEIQKGYMVLIGICQSDTREIADKMVKKLINMRIFEDENGKTNLSLADVSGQLLLISQFTLFADLKSRRPGFSGAAKPDVAIPLYEKFMDECRAHGFHVECGEFGADMKVSSVNDGPVTLLFDTEK